MSTHAVLAPSSAHRWMECLAAPAMEKETRDRKSSAYSAEGTLAHTLAATSLSLPEDQGNAYLAAQVGVEHGVDGFRIALGPEDVEAIRVYTDAIRSYATQAQVAYVECPISIDKITTEANATGTADTVLVVGTALEVHDLKFGKGVWVDAKENKQLLMYAAGTYLELHKSFPQIDTINLFIHQPRIFPQPSTWSCNVKYLKEFIDFAKLSASAALDMYHGRAPLEFSPNEKTCEFCSARARCQARSDLVAKITGADFDDITQSLIPAPPRDDNARLENMMLQVQFIEDWCRDVRAEMETQLLQGASFEHFKLVQGRKGSRKWTDDAEVEAMLKKLRLSKDEMYDFKLISPTTAEKLFKAKPQTWAKVAKHVTQTEGKPHVAPMSDKRPAITVSTDDFTDLTQ